MQGGALLLHEVRLVLGVILGSLQRKHILHKVRRGACLRSRRSGKAYLLLLLEDVFEALVFFLHVHHLVLLLPRPAALLLQQLLKLGNHVRRKLTEVATDVRFCSRHWRYLLHVLCWERPTVHLQYTLNPTLLKLGNRAFEKPSSTNFQHVLPSTSLDWTWLQPLACERLRMGPTSLPPPPPPPPPLDRVERCCAAVTAKTTGLRRQVLRRCRVILTFGFLLLEERGRGSLTV